MSSVPNDVQLLILGLLDGSIPEPEFLKKFQVRLKDMPRKVASMLDTAIVEKDSVGVEYGLYLLHKYQVTEGVLEQLNRLVEADWHEWHEDAVDGLSKLNSPSSVGYLQAAALASHPYLEFDESFSLGRKAVWALSGIESIDAILALDRIRKAGKKIVSDEAENRLKAIGAKSRNESFRAAISNLLAS